MKLRKLVLPMLAIMLLAAGCTKEYYGAQVQTFQFNVNPTDWVRNQVSNVDEPAGNNYLYFEKAIPAINEEVFYYGTVQMFCWNEYNTENHLGAWNTLPFVYPLEVYENGNNTPTIVPENLRFEWEMGKVTIIIHDLDGYAPESMVFEGAKPISFKVCVTTNM